MVNIARTLIEETTPKIRLLSPDELANSLDFVWKVFLEFEAVNYPEEGKTAFYSAIHSQDYLSMLTAYGAFDQDEIIGIIATRNEGAHMKKKEIMNDIRITGNLF